MTSAYVYTPLVYLTIDTCRIRCGDKLTTRHSQKGVVGGIKRSHELPRPATPAGSLPSIVMNPKGILKRKSLNLPFEVCRLNKFFDSVRKSKGVSRMVFSGYGHGMCADCLGTLLKDNIRSRRCKRSCIFTAHHTEFGDVAPFGSSDAGDMSWVKGENTIFTTPRANVKQKLFMGLGYIMSNVNKTLTKSHMRHRGPMDRFNQPTVGKINNGGHRWGFSERDMTLASGGSNINLDRSLFGSDAVRIQVCVSCGQPKHATKDMLCVCFCGSTKFWEVTTSYSVIAMTSLLVSARIRFSIVYRQRSGCQIYLK